MGIEQISNYLDKTIAEATLQGDAIELKQILKVTNFVSQVAEERGDRATAQHFRRLSQIVDDALGRLRK